MDKRRHGSSSIQLEPIRTTGLILAESLLPATQTSRQQPRKFSAWWGVYTYKHYPIYIINFFTTIYFSHDFCNHCDISLTNNKTSKKSLDMRKEIVNPPPPPPPSKTDVKLQVNKNFASKGIVAICSDTNTGREFLMSQHSNTQCDTYGWIMISTQNNCPFEASAGGKPAFLYSPGQTSSHFEQSENKLRASLFCCWLTNTN